MSVKQGLTEPPPRKRNETSGASIDFGGNIYHIMMLCLNSLTNDLKASSSEKGPEREQALLPCCAVLSSSACSPTTCSLVLSLSNDAVSVGVD